MRQHQGCGSLRPEHACMRDAHRARSMCPRSARVLGDSVAAGRLVVPRMQGETHMHSTEKLTGKPSTTTDSAHMPNAATAERTVILERILAGSPTQVFQAWTDPEQLVKWF